MLVSGQTSLSPGCNHFAIQSCLWKIMPVLFTDSHLLSCWFLWKENSRICEVCITYKKALNDGFRVFSQICELVLSNWWQNICNFTLKSTWAELFGDNWCFKFLSQHYLVHHFVCLFDLFSKSDNIHGIQIAIWWYKIPNL